MMRREFLWAMPSLLTDHRTAPAATGRYVYRWMGGRYEAIAWEDQRPGNTILLIDFDRGRIGRVARYVVLRAPDRAKEGWPVEVGNQEEL